jgi:hypothetical protein
MRMKRFSLLLLALVFIASLAVVGCGGGGAASFQVTNLVINPSEIEAGGEVAISVSVANSGDASGSYAATLTVAGTAVETKNVEIAAGASATVSFDYSPADAGTLAISIGGQSDSLVVIPGEDYWEIEYNAVAGSYIVLNYSPAGMTPLYKKITFDETDGISLVMRVYKSVAGGAREVRIPAATWVFPSFPVDDIMTGIDMDLLMPLAVDAVGTLYVQDGIGDVDMSSESTASASPIQVDTQGDGTKDPAGSMLIPLTLVGEFETSVGQDGELPFGLIFTTGNTDNIVHITLNKKMDGATIESEGAPFAKDGGPADYVGTTGTIVTTGTGECLGIKLVGVRIDFQTEIKLVLEPVD